MICGITKLNEITLPVMQEVTVIDNGVGTVDDFDLAVTHREATQALLEFLDHRLESFDSYEDAMSNRYEILFQATNASSCQLGAVLCIYLL